MRNMDLLSSFEKALVQAHSATDGQQVRAYLTPANLCSLYEHLIEMVAVIKDFGRHLNRLDDGTKGFADRLFAMEMAFEWDDPQPRPIIKKRKTAKKPARRKAK